MSWTNCAALLSPVALINPVDVTRKLQFNSAIAYVSRNESSIPCYRYGVCVICVHFPFCSTKSNGHAQSSIFAITNHW